MTTNTGGSVLFQSTYGRFRTRFLCFMPLLAILGLVGVPVGIFYNEGWEMNNRPMEPWAATMIIEICAVGILLTVASVVIGEVLRRKSPQHVVVTDSSLIVPKGRMSNAELTLPFSEIKKISIYDMGFVKQIQIKHQGTRVLLTSAMFPSNADFDRLVIHLPK